MSAGRLSVELESLCARLRELHDDVSRIQHNVEETDRSLEVLKDSIRRRIAGGETQRDPAAPAPGGPPQDASAR